VREKPLCMTGFLLCLSQTNHLRSAKTPYHRSSGSMEASGEIFRWTATQKNTLEMLVIHITACSFSRISTCVKNLYLLTEVEKLGILTADTK
jgi:hypothetical protein